MNKDLVKLTARPRLYSPNMLACWPGVGNVSLIIATYLRSKLNFKDLAEVNPANFFDPIGVAAVDSIIEEPQFPQSKFYYRKNDAGGEDLILFIGEDQPSAKSYELANCVLDVATRFHVKRVYTCAAALTRIHHTEQPRVWGVATNQTVARYLKKLELIQKGNLQIAGLNGLLLGVAKEREIDGICLLGEVPSYASRMPNPMAALAVLKVISKMLDVKIDTVELSSLADETREKMRQAAAEAMGQYIDYFTQPIWEQEQEGEGEGEDEDGSGNEEGV
ncbi:MAG: PAC2 family protein [Dehalococcoidia bacterium]|nr:PAC2 family protein [Dehalococcoidia bacterium]